MPVSGAAAGAAVEAKAAIRQRARASETPQEEEDRWYANMLLFYETRQKKRKQSLDLFSARNQPCFGTTLQLPDMIAATDKELSDVREQILRLKNDVLFGYLSKEQAVEAFRELKDRALEKSGTLHSDYNEYFDLLENAETISQGRTLQRQMQMYLSQYDAKRQTLKWRTQQERRQVLRDMAGLVALMDVNREKARGLRWAATELVVEAEENEPLAEGDVIAASSGAYAMKWTVRDTDMFEKTLGRKFPDQLSVNAGSSRKPSERANMKDGSSLLGLDSSAEDLDNVDLDAIEDVEDMESGDTEITNAGSPKAAGEGGKTMNKIVKIPARKVSDEETGDIARRNSEPFSATATSTPAESKKKRTLKFLQHLVRERKNANRTLRHWS